LASKSGAPGKTSRLDAVLILEERRKKKVSYTPEIRHDLSASIGLRGARTAMNE
jgi:hypothetical protein